ncbi:MULTISPECIES: hypothetical protein [unclassified Rhizobium]|uniref:hypothetical protein n=1 Tax=unclassified Rhizobium TaxID=2613769 RepID=UPI000BE8CD79|nr:MULTISPECIES: hypothetical protein [unclassified Rhizobium]MDF0663672.1 hypothetical protein [Rhizobium sp. BC49]PDS80420.1 hypothetical protein CO654_30950 [Rhizobium sp. L18]
MIQHTENTELALLPDDLATLTAVLEGWWVEKSCEIASPVAEHVARELVSWFECGIRERRLAGLARHAHLDLENLKISTEAPSANSGRALKISQFARGEG